MNKRILLAALAILAAGILYKRSMQGMEKSDDSSSLSSIAADIVALKSDNGKSIFIPRNIAEQSPVLKGFLKDFVEHNNPIPIPFSSDVIIPVVALLKQKSKSLHLGDEVINEFVAPDGTCNMKLLMAVAELSDYLAIDSLTDSLMELYIFQFSKAHREATITDLNNTIAIPKLQDLTSKLFPYIRSSAGFKALEESITADGVLDLAKKDITNLYGLSLIEHKNTIKTLSLSHNKIKTIRARVFAGFTDLQILDLSYNENLRILEYGAFEGLSKLNELNLRVTPLLVGSKAEIKAYYFPVDRRIYILK